MTFGQEFANHWLQLYRLDTLGAEVKFFWSEGHVLKRKAALEKSFDEARIQKRKLTAPNLIVEKPYVRILSFRMLSIIADPHPQPSDFNHKAIGPTDTNPSRSERLNPIHTEPDFEFPPSNPSASIPTLHGGNDVEIGTSNGGLNQWESNDARTSAKEHCTFPFTA